MASSTVPLSDYVDASLPSSRSDMTRQHATRRIPWSGPSLEVSTVHLWLRRTASSTLSALHRPLGASATRRYVRQHRPPFRVSVGSHDFARPGWLATDITWRCPYYLDITKAWPMPPETVSHVFADNVVEHLTLPEAREFFIHAQTAMAPGGRIRLATPDIHSLADLYLNGPEGTVQDALSWFAGRGVLAEHPVDLLRTAFAEYGHHAGYMWDPASMRAELTRAGFERIEILPAGQSADPELRGLEVRMDSVSVQIQFSVEAVKG